MNKKSLFGVVFAFFLSVSLMSPVMGAVNLPDGYATDLDLSEPIVYSIDGVKEGFEFVEWWGKGFCLVEKGGTIEFLFLDVHTYDNWGVPATDLFFNVTFKSASGELNRTVANVTDSEIAMTLLLSFGSLSGGVITDLNWTNQDAIATASANTPADNFFLGYMNGTLSTNSANGMHTFDYKQNPDKGTQETLLKYDEETGILQSWDSSFGDFDVQASIVDPDESAGIPGFPLEILGLITISSIVLLIKKSRK